MKPRRLSQRQLALRYRSMSDMFGQIPVTRHDVYAWLLGVANIDPGSERALQYYRGYNVAYKIAAAKLEGTFDEWTQAARNSARYRELLVEPPARVTSSNVAGLADWTPPPAATPQLKKPTRAARRPKEVVKKEKERMRHEIGVRKLLRLSPLSRLPKDLPPLEHLLDDVGNPTADMLGMAFDVHATTARRWISSDEAPLAVKLALYWITDAGMQTLDATLQSEAAANARLARALEDRVKELERLLANTARVAEFGSANDPSPLAQVPLASQADGVPLAVLKAA